MLASIAIVLGMALSCAGVAMSASLLIDSDVAHDKDLNRPAIYANIAIMSVITIVMIVFALFTKDCYAGPVFNAVGKIPGPSFALFGFALVCMNLMVVIATMVPVRNSVTGDKKIIADVAMMLQLGALILPIAVAYWMHQCHQREKGTAVNAEDLEKILEDHNDKKAEGEAAKEAANEDTKRRQRDSVNLEFSDK